MPKIVVTHPVFAETKALLAAQASVDVNPDVEPWSADEVRARCRDADALLVFMTDRIDAAFLEACPRLCVIGGALKGYDNIDVVAAERAGVWVTIVPDLLTAPTAELAIGLMLSLGRHIVAADRSIRERGFSGWRPTFYGAGLEGATVGIVGFGQVGQAIAARLVPFGCRLLVWDRQAPSGSRPLDGRVSVESLDGLLNASDFVVLALPLVQATFHLVDGSFLERMKPGARLVNPARGSLVDERAVADALASGRLAGYAADVFECEDWARADRPAAISPGLTTGNAPTVLTPHLGSAVETARREIELSAARSILEALDGRTPSGAVNNPQNRSHAQSLARQDFPDGH